MNAKKIAGWAVVIVLGYYLFTKPHAASAEVHNVLNLLKQGGASIASFLHGL